MTWFWLSDKREAEEIDTMIRSLAIKTHSPKQSITALIERGPATAERTEDECRGLYEAAGFELTRTVVNASPTGTAVIEGRPRQIAGQRFYTQNYV